MKKKVLSLLLVFALGSSVFSAALAAGNEPTFSDVPASHWAFTFIEELVERKAINGYPDGRFYPDKTVSREEFAKIMVVAAGLTASPAAESTYADVPLTYWASPYIETARPYMTAYQNQGQLFFYPTAGALREDIAVAVVKLKGLDATMADQSILSTMFHDVGSISEAARPYVALAVEQGIINGYTDGTFRGQGTITRSEAAAMLWRAFQQGSGDKVIPDDILPPATPSQSPTPAPTVTPTPAPTPSATPSPTPTPTPEPVREPKPGDIMYGIVSAFHGHVKKDGTAYRYVTVQSRGESYSAYLDSTVKNGDKAVSVGDIVVMDVTADDIYNHNDFEVINTYDWISNSKHHAVAGYVKTYSEKDGTVTVGTACERDGDTYKVSGNGNTFAITKDTAIYYVDRDSNVAVESASLGAMDAITHTMNIIVIGDGDARNGDEAAVIIFETSNEADIVTDVEKF